MKGVVMYPPAAVFAIMLIILLHGYCCGASVLVKTNTTFLCDGRLDECLIEEDLELDFLMNPYVSRVLVENHNDPTDPKNPFFGVCGGGPNYSNCVAEYKRNHHGCDPKHVYAGRGDC